MQYEMPILSEERQTLIGLCRIEVRRWKQAAEAVPDKRYMVELMKIALSALMQKTAEAPAGWQLVPLEPTTEMLEEIWLDERFKEVAIKRRYQALLAAAPEPE